MRRGDHTGPEPSEDLPGAHAALTGGLRRAAPLAAAVAGAGLAGLGAAGWIGSSALLRAGQSRPARIRGLRLVEVDGQNLTVVGADAAQPGCWGLVWDGGYARVGPVAATEDSGRRTRARRSFRLLEGTLPMLPAEVRWDATTSPESPEALGLPWRPMDVPGPFGSLPAWVFPADGATHWAVLAHGRRSSRAQTFRAVQTLHRLGLTCLVISYRTDHWAPHTNRSTLGLTEWQDVEAAVATAIGAGARGVVLVGYSLGGGIALNLLRRSAMADRVCGVVLDAPVLDWAPVLRRVAASLRLPRAVATASMTAAQLRTGMQWAELNHLAAADELTHPTLLVHGSDDPVVPVTVSDRFAHRRPDLVTYLRVRGAGHCNAWNLDPAAYDDVLADFAHGLGVATRGGQEPGPAAWPVRRRRRRRSAPPRARQPRLQSA